MAVEDRIETLRQVYLGIGEAIQVMRDHEKNQQKLERLEKTVKSQIEKITDLQTQLKALERLTGQKVKICPECNGAGAYKIGDDLEECDKCDGVGALEVIK